MRPLETSPLTDDRMPPSVGRGEPLALRWHPAARAWLRTAPDRSSPRAIEVLKRRKDSVTYRVWGVGPMAGSVIAKRCRASAARVELWINQRMLPDLPLSTPGFLGQAPDDDPRFMWIFLEDAGERRYSASDPEHRELLTRWMATLHTSAASLPGATELPDRGATHFLETLRHTRGDIDRHIAASLLFEEHLSMLKRLRLCLDVVESCWPMMMDLCEGAPSTLVHGSLKERNVRVRHAADGTILMPFDWDRAGWGPPAVDLSRCPLTSLYGFLVRRRWP